MWLCGEGSGLWPAKQGREGLYEDHTQRIQRTQIPIARRKVASDSIVLSDCWRGHKALDVSDSHRLRTSLPELFTDRSTHISGPRIIDPGQAQNAQIQWCSKTQLGLYLQECEWRFNNSDPSAQLSQQRERNKLHLGRESYNYYTISNSQKY